MYKPTQRNAKVVKNCERNISFSMLFLWIRALLMRCLAQRNTKVHLWDQDSLSMESKSQSRAQVCHVESASNIYLEKGWGQFIFMLPLILIEYVPYILGWIFHCQRGCQNREECGWWVELNQSKDLQYWSRMGLKVGGDLWVEGRHSMECMSEVQKLVRLNPTGI